MKLSKDTKSLHQCPLCFEEAFLFQKINNETYYACKNCKGIFLSENFHLDENKEEDRYQLHENNILDKGYQEFVKPLVNLIQSNISKNTRGLDFGCGKAPVASHLLQQSGYQIQFYDPYFQPDEKVLNRNYQFIICCEVMEHFNEPHSEFQLLFDLLQPNGKLFCKTQLFQSSINFEKWWYKNDPTHIFFYQNETLEFIRQEFGFKSLKIQDEVIVFTK